MWDNDQLIGCHEIVVLIECHVKRITCYKKLIKKSFTLFCNNWFYEGLACLNHLGLVEIFARHSCIDNAYNNNNIIMIYV